MSMSAERIDEIRAQAEAQRRERATNGNGYHVDDEPPVNGAQVDNPHPDDPGPAEPPNVDAGDDESAIAKRHWWLRINHEARRRLDEENRPALALPPVKPFATFINEPSNPVRYRIDKVLPSGARNLISAQYKAGKTATVANLARSLADGVPFLGRFAVNAAAQHLVIIDDELDEDMLRDWLRAQDIGNRDAIAEVIPLRGRVASFNILDDHTRDQWATRLRDHGCDYLAVDCLRPILDALGLDEHRNAGKFVVAFDELLAQAGIRDATLVQHMGHTGERSRGDSRLQDWPDVLWSIVRETEDPASDRYFKAYGRGVNVPEGRLSYDEDSHRLTYLGGNRVDAKVEDAYRAVIELLAATKDAVSKSHIEDELADRHTQKAIRTAIAKTVRDGHVAVAPERGPHGAKMHHIAYPCSECGLPVVSREGRHLSCPPNVAGLF